MYKWLLVVTLSLCVISTANAKESDGLIKQTVSEEATQLLGDARFTSTSIGVIHGEHALTQHFGELTKTKGDKPTDQTIYEIGSVSKTMVGLLVANALKNDLVALDVNINRYLNNELGKVSPNNNPITLRQLLTHSSGLPNSYFDLGLESNGLTRTAFINKVNNAPIAKQKGKFNYSSVGTELLCYVLETVYKTPFDTLLATFFKNNLGMQNTRVNLLPNQLPLLARGYNTEQQIAISHTANNTLWGGSGYIKSSMTDLMAYMRYQLQAKNALVQLTHKKLFEVSPTDGFGFLWIVSHDKKLGDYIIHHGGVESTQNWMMIFPKHQLAISVVSNSSFPEAAGILRNTGMQIANKLIGQ